VSRVDWLTYPPAIVLAAVAVVLFKLPRWLRLVDDAQDVGG
jgi:hypothetical protein